MTAKGSAICHAVIDYGVDFDLLWVCFIDATGEGWTFNNRDVRSVENFTMKNPSRHLPGQKHGERVKPRKPKKVNRK